MNIKVKSLIFVLTSLLSIVFINPVNIFAATSPGLGEAASFAVLAGTAITNVPTSVITGDVGLSPAAGSNYAGLNTSEVSGTIFAPDSSGPDGITGDNPDLLTVAKTDLVTAYNGLASGDNADASCNVSYSFGAGNKDLSGASLAPGVYCADTFTLTGTLPLADPEFGFLDQRQHLSLLVQRMLWVVMHAMSGGKFLPQQH